MLLTRNGIRCSKCSRRKFCVMPTMLLARQTPALESSIDSEEDIAEMMAEAARVDALFQSGAISTLFLSAFTGTASRNEAPEALLLKTA